MHRINDSSLKKVEKYIRIGRPLALPEPEPTRPFGLSLPEPEPTRPFGLSLPEPTYRHRPDLYGQQIS